MPTSAASNLSILVVMPLYPPATGGAATYAAMLARFLEDSTFVRRVAVLTTYSPGARLVERRGKLRVYRFLPPRFTSPLLRLALRFVTDLVILLVLATSGLLRRYRIVHVHANYAWIGARLPNLALELLLRLFGLRGVLDLRDSIVAPRRSRAWRATICVSRAIETRARGAGVAAATCLYAPPPLDVAAVRAAAERGRSRLSDAAGGRPYLCFAGVVTLGKGVEALLGAFRLYRSRAGLASGEGLALVFVGPFAPRTKRELAWSRGLATDRDVIFLGPRPWADALAVIAAAELLVLPSYAEGIPRVCLEALALGRRVLFPPGIVEFEASCPEYVLPAITAETICDAIASALARPGHPRYDLAAHDPRAVFGRYLALYRPDSSAPQTAVADDGLPLVAGR